MTRQEKFESVPALIVRHWRYALVGAAIGGFAVFPGLKIAMAVLAAAVGAGQ